MLRFVVPGEAVAWQRVTRGKFHGKAVLPAETRAHEELVAQHAQLAICKARVEAEKKGTTWHGYPQEGPFWLGAGFYLGTYHVKGHLHEFDPDLDNLVKTVKDGLQGIVWHNDKQVRGFLPGTRKVLGCKHPQTLVVICHEREAGYLLEMWQELPKD